MCVHVRFSEVWLYIGFVPWNSSVVYVQTTLTGCLPCLNIKGFHRIPYGISPGSQFHIFVSIWNHPNFNMFLNWFKWCGLHLMWNIVSIWQHRWFHMEAHTVLWHSSRDDMEVIEVKASFWYSVLFIIPIVLVYAMEEYMYLSDDCVFYCDLVCIFYVYTDVVQNS